MNRPVLRCMSRCAFQAALDTWKEGWCDPWLAVVPAVPVIQLYPFPVWRRQRCIFQLSSLDPRSTVGGHMLKLRESEGHLGARHGNRSTATTLAIRWGGFQFCHAINSLRRLSVPLHNWACQASGANTIVTQFLGYSVILWPSYPIHSMRQ